MNESLKILDVVATFLAGGALIWAIKLVGTLRDGISAQKGIIDSFKSQTDYIGNVQSTVSKLYDPTEIEKLVKVKVTGRTQQITKDYEGLSASYKRTLKSVYRISVWAAIRSSDKDFIQLKKTAPSAPGRPLRGRPCYWRYTSKL